MITLTCTRCGAEQSTDAFYRKGEAGHRMPCKRCVGETQRRYHATEDGRASQRRGSRRYETSAHGKEARREYNAGPKGKRKARRYATSEKGRRVHAASTARARARHPDQARARKAVAWAVKITAGIFREDICADCGRVGRTEGHHHRGYDREHWLDVRWLCLRCHRAADEEKREAA